MTDSPPLLAQPVAVEAKAVSLTRLYQLLVLVVAAASVMVAIWLVSDVLTLVFAAVLLAVILHGVSMLLVRAVGLPYGAALALVLVAALAILGGLAVWAGPGFVEQALALRGALLSQAQALRERLETTQWGGVILDQVPSSLGGNKEGGLAAMSAGVAGRVAGFLNSALGLFGTFAVVVITAIYFAAAPALYVNGALHLVPPRHRDAAKVYAETAGSALWAWSAGQALDMLVVGVLSGLGLWLIGVPLALVLGVIAALFNFVPYVGAIIGAVPAVIIAFSVGRTAGFETVALYAVIQGFEGNVLAPMIQSRAVKMPPGLTILSQTVFGSLLGLPGLIFATPLTAMLLAVMGKATTPLAPEHRISIAGPD